MGGKRGQLNIVNNCPEKTSSIDSFMTTLILEVGVELKLYVSGVRIVIRRQRLKPLVRQPRTLST